MADGGWAILLSNEGSLSLLARPARLLAGWAHDTTAVVRGEVQTGKVKDRTLKIEGCGTRIVLAVHVCATRPQDKNPD
jgi:hypothetical protein